MIFLPLDLFYNPVSRNASWAEENKMSQEVLSIKSDPLKVVAKSEEGEERLVHNKQYHNILGTGGSYHLLLTSIN